MADQADTIQGGIDQDEFSWKNAVLVAHDASIYHASRTRLFILMANRSILPQFLRGIESKAFVLPHLVGIYDSPARLASAVRREYQRYPDKIMVIRLFSRCNEEVGWVEPLILDANIRTAVVGDYLQNRKGFHCRLNDKSKFGDSLLSSCKHGNLFVKDVGYFSPERYQRYGSGALTASSTVFLGLGTKAIPWFSASVIGSWGIPAAIGAPLTVTASTAYLGYLAHTALAKWRAEGGLTANNTDRQIVLEDIMIDDLDDLGRLANRNSFDS